ncbi:SGNH/GDSL hydrolase family protein [Hyunsoonleella pacifica]|uniref:SGNH/GDSL hydrolase family protein n=1 Tax=Hyunsoonleella pacifica TaxID=1080224 RepID=A0A4Q9FS81_9FLAO|nr:SGNH/GDSL hydrolase family protein [Hyunsoonleella pacifica]TBN18666.1 SGNH/GDSL hydrolase family protein [Hyunsoonleella pacifica]
MTLNFACAQENATTKEEIVEHYLDSLKKELKVKWPKNRTINLVFHGHSVPTGYTTRGVLDRLNSYPYRTLKKVNDFYPYSVVNTITTSIGGEQAEQGAKRFKEDVLNHKPDVLFIDYGLNDRSIGLERAKVAWEQMIQEALEYGTKVILLTPTPDLKEDITSNETPLAQHSSQIRALAKKYKIGLVDSYALFKALAEIQPLKGYMSQNNHINQKGHQFVADAIFEYFKIQ